MKMPRTYKCIQIHPESLHNTLVTTIWHSKIIASTVALKLIISSPFKKKYAIMEYVHDTI